MPQLYIRRATPTERVNPLELGYVISHVLTFEGGSGTKDVENTTNETPLD